MPETREGDLEKLLAAAYDAGDTDAVLRLLAGDTSIPAAVASPSSPLPPPPSTTFPSLESLSLNPRQHRLNTSAPCFQMPSIPSPPPQPDTLSNLSKAFPAADTSIIQALLLAHGNDPMAAETSLTELEYLGALNPSSAPDIDTSAYASAVQDFNSDFPSLGGAALTARPARPDAHLLRTMREQSLATAFPWVGAAAISAALAAHGDVESARAAIRTHYPQPNGWVDPRVAKAEEAVRAAIAAATAGLRANSYEEVGEVAGTRWTKSGEYVARVYAEKREGARTAARERNGWFEKAAEAARKGRGGEAAKMGRLGREAGERMKALHVEAAELLWAESNGDFVRDKLLDLHGLHVAEAIERLPWAFAEARRGGLQTLRVVFGTGHHSRGGNSAPRLRPAVLEFLKKEGYAFDEVLDKKTKFVCGASVYLA